MIVSIYKIENQVTEFYVYGKGKVTDLLLDDGESVNKIDGLLDDLDQMVTVTTKTLIVERLEFDIGESVSDASGHDLKVIAVTSNGQYVLGDETNKTVKYYNQTDVFKYTNSITPAQTAAISKIWQSGDDIADHGDLLAEFEAMLGIDDKEEFTGCGYRNPNCNIVENKFQTFTSIYCRTCCDEVVGKGLIK